jgi:hypothetical protein
VNAGLGSWAAHDTDGLSRALARARIGLSSLAPHGQSPQVSDTSIALNALEALQIHSDLAAQVAFDYVLAILDRVNDLGELLLSQVLGPNARVNLGPGQDVDGVARADAVNIAQGNIDALVGGDFYTNDTGHKLELECWISGLALALLVPGVRANDTNHTLATDDLAILAELFY